MGWRCYTFSTKETGLYWKCKYSTLVTLAHEIVSVVLNSKESWIMRISCVFDRLWKLVVSDGPNLSVGSLLNKLFFVMGVAYTFTSLHVPQSLEIYKIFQNYTNFSLLVWGGGGGDLWLLLPLCNALLWADLIYNCFFIKFEYKSNIELKHSWSFDCNWIISVDTRYNKSSQCSPQEIFEKLTFVSTNIEKAYQPYLFHSYMVYFLWPPTLR